MDDQSQTVLTSKSGIKYIPSKILKKGIESYSEAILARVPHNNSSTLDLVLAIKRYRITKSGVKIQDDPKRNISLDHEELSNLIEYLTENLPSFKAGLERYLNVDLTKTPLNPTQILDYINNSSSDIENIIPVTEITPQLDSIANAIKIQEFTRLIEEFQERLSKNIGEDSGVNPWQTWFMNNYCFFGPNYKRPISKTKINIKGSKPDFLLVTIDGCVDGLDIKKPNVPNIIVEDPSHTGSFYWSSDVNKSIGQLVNYLYDMDENRYQLAEELGISIARPRGIIVIGRSNNWTEKEIRAYRKLSYSLHGIEVLTYDHLLDRARQMLENLS